jgi:hypothetical protein
MIIIQIKNEQGKNGSKTVTILILEGTEKNRFEKRYSFLCVLCG